MLDRLQTAMGMEIKDLALLFGSVSFIVGLLVLGASGNLYRGRWPARLGWLLGIGGIAVAAYGMIHGSPAATA